MSWSRGQIWSAVAVAAALGLILVWALTSSSGDEEAKSEASATTATTSQSSGPTTKASPTPPPTQVTAKPVGKKPDLDSQVELSDGATARITKIEKVQSQGELPGETSAPALRFTVEATAGSEPLNLATVVVSISGPGGKPFGGSLASGKSAKAVYIFNIPVAERDNVAVEFSWSGKEKPVVLSGNVG